MLFLESVDANKDISIYINSPGGGVYAGLGIYDTMQFIKPDVATICTGMAASMGAVLMCAGQKGKRSAVPHSRIMIHQPLGGAQGQASDIAITAREILKLKDELYSIIAKHSGQKFEKVHEDSDRDLTISEVSSLHMEVYNPATTRAKKENFDTLVKEIKELELPNETIASNIIRALYKRRIANKIAVLATQIYNGKDSDFSEIKKELEISFDDIDKDEYEYVTSDVSSLIDKLKDNTKWKFNLSSLKPIT